MADLSLEMVEFEILELLKEVGLDRHSLESIEEMVGSVGKTELAMLSSELRGILHHLFALRAALMENPDFFKPDPSSQPG